ncbi:TetR/AcrR family transcriptional regulator [Bauldia litoralis]|uniref:Transcriptional regulator, TetR family n=1 Tax=Bauldia litoralis TaxID=665467 RepID=A0A1G6CSJ1_9HYPH|nr:TetR/AcrR family transcriptional regulator [Bauldia litoralis]SDB35822.1 transcriptional regulator, TetR family [Bauldia litoralis]
MARDGTATKARIIKAASRLFYTDGIRAVSVDAVAEKAGVTKKTLYYHFRSKDDLVTAYLQARDQPNLDAFRRWFDEADGGLGDKVFAIFDGVARAARRPSWRGCGFLRTAGELANQPGHPAIKAGVAHKKRFEAWLAGECSEAGLTAPEVAARRLVILMDGAFAGSLIHRDPDYIIEAGHAARLLIATTGRSR